MRRLLQNWPNIALIFVPLFIGVVDAAVLIVEQRAPETEKAIRRVKESTSRKENFTVQQYLYTTVYFRQKQGQAIEIEGWRAEQALGLPTPVTVGFSYIDASGSQVAIWDVDITTGRVTPMNETAHELSWH